MACPRDIDQWIELAKDCKYLTENDLKVTPGSSEVVEFPSVAMGSLKYTY